MNVRRVTAVARKEFLHVVRDSRSLATGVGHARLDAAAVRFCPDARRGQGSDGRVGSKRNRPEPRFHQPVQRLEVFFGQTVCQRLRSAGPRDRHAPGDDGVDRAARFCPAARSRPRRLGPIDRRRQRFEHGHDRHQLCRRGGDHVRLGRDGRGEQSPRRDKHPHSFGRAAEDLVQRGLGIAEFHYSRA